MEIVIGFVVVAQTATILVLVRWIVVNAPRFRESKPIEPKPEKPKASFGGPPFGVKTK